MPTTEDEIELKGGFTTKDPRLDRLPEFDEASRQYPIRTYVRYGTAVEDKKARSFSWTLHYWLDQLKEGRCVEYALCHDLLARPVMVHPTIVNAILKDKRIYWPAQREDQWPGGSYPGAEPRYEGTSVLAGIKVATRLGFYKEYRWAFTLEDAVLALGHVGPLILGINWYGSMFNTDADGWLQVSGSPQGGHAILANKVRLVWRQGTAPVDRLGPEWVNYLDLDASYLGLWNTWGRTWGKDGTGKLSLRNFDRLRKEQGEVAIAVGRQTVASLPPAA